MNKCPLCNDSFLFNKEKEYNLHAFKYFTCLNCEFKYGIYNKNIDYIEFNYNHIYKIYYYINNFTICKYDDYYKVFIPILKFSNENINIYFSGIKDVYNLSIKYIDNMVFL